MQQLNELRMMHALLKEQVRNKYIAEGQEENLDEHSSLSSCESEKMLNRKQLISEQETKVKKTAVKKRCEEKKHQDADVKSSLQSFQGKCIKAKRSPTPAEMKLKYLIAPSDEAIGRRSVKNKSKTTARVRTVGEGAQVIKSSKKKRTVDSSGQAIKMKLVSVPPLCRQEIVISRNVHRRKK